MNSLARFKCPKCQSAIQIDARKLRYVQQRETELQAWEQRLRGLEQRLDVRKADHESDVRRIRSCLHPDKHPEQAERYTRAWQALERLLTPATKPAREEWDDNIPF
jgi:hypothetical protein